jgi:hypothetical protein
MHYVFVPNPQVSMVIWFTRRGVYQPFSRTRSGVELASQAQYAGSIPVIGSTACARSRLYFGFSEVIRSAIGLEEHGLVPGTVP